jgi:surface carbohydrate biosynthesis protein
MNTLFLPLEVFHREYLGKLSLGLEVLQTNSDAKVILGYNQIVRTLALGGENKGVYYEIKGKTKKGMEYLSEIKLLGNYCVAQDEEAGISYTNFEDFIFFRSEMYGLDFFDFFFAWGKDDYEFIKFYTRNSTVTGSPRLSFWNRRVSTIYEKEIIDCRTRYGEYILIITGFATANSIMSEKETRNQYRSHSYNQSSYIAREKRRSWQQEGIRETDKIIHYILKNSNKNIVIRPHPSENIAYWEEKAKNNRIFVDRNIEVSPILLGANKILHSGSTLALEALFLGCDIATYSPIIGESDYLKFANQLTFKIENYRDLDNFIFGKNTRINFDFEAFNTRAKYVGLKDPISLQANKINELLRKSPQIKISDLDSKKLNISQGRYFYRLKRRFNSGKSSYQLQHNSKRPKIQQQKIESDIVKLAKFFKTEYHVKVKEIAESTFELTSSQSKI